MDKDGHARKEIRIKWWMNPNGVLLDELSIPSGLGLGDAQFDSSKGDEFYSDDKPVFFGHYWLQGVPKLQTDKVCCLDFSVAKGGVLAAYRYDGEESLSDDRLVYV
jgi:hypothetical protein